MNIPADCSRPAAAEFLSRCCRRLRDSVADARERLIARHAALTPHRRELIRHAVSEAERQAWETPFPHLFFADFAEARLAAVTSSSSDRAPVEFSNY